MTQVQIKIAVEYCISIHTPAKGVTRGYCYDWQVLDDFNPHSREGSDNGTDVSGITATISIHTPAKGVTLSSLNLLSKLHISIHTPAKGVTFHLSINIDVGKYFNPHSREGSDGVSGGMITYYRGFQSTLPRRE